MGSDTEAPRDDMRVDEDAHKDDAASKSGKLDKHDGDFDDDLSDSRKNREAAQEKCEVETRVVAPAKEAHKRTVVDRAKTTPFLLRVFPKENDFNRMDEFARAKLPQNELQIYTWKSETLRNLTALIKSQIPSFRAKDTKFFFGAASPDNRGNYSLRELGMTIGGRKGEDDAQSLEDLNFRIGDFIVVRILIPRDARDGDRRRDGGRFGGRDEREGERRGFRDGRDRDRDAPRRR